MLAFKKNSPFRSCISKINSKFIGNAEDLDITKPMYNMLEIIGSTPADNNRLDAETKVVVSFKYLSIFLVFI